MKRFSLLILALCALFLIPEKVQANDFLERMYHYQVSTTGEGTIHFKLPVYSRGGYNYFIKDNQYMSSSIYYTLEGTTSRVTLFRFHGEMNSDGPSANDGLNYGYAYVLSNVEGILEVTNLSGGGSVRHSNDNKFYEYKVEKKEEYDNGNDYVTWLEINWYPPEGLDNKKFKIGMEVYISTRFRDPNDYNYHKTWTFDGSFSGRNNLIDPQLMDPYFYAVGSTGAGGYGSAAVPYSLFYEPKDYRTFFDTTKVNPISDRSGTIFVPTTDTIQPEFGAKFTIYVDKEKDDKRVLSSQKVAIPAFHRIYDFKMVEEVDSTNTYTGNTVLSWTIRNPQVVDLVEGDMFEIQRAFKADYSDAKTLNVLSMQRGANYGSYSFVDNSRDAWTGNNSAFTYDTMRHYLNTELPNYELRNDTGALLATLNLTLTANKLRAPAVPVYYRIRRASTSVWGWTHDFAKSGRMAKHNFLAPLAASLPNYEPDKEYTKNHQVHFAIPLDNKAVQIQKPDTADCSLSYEIVEAANTVVKLEIEVQGYQQSTLHSNAEVYCAIYDDDNELVKSEWRISGSETLEVPGESELIVRYKDVATGNGFRAQSYPLNSSSKLIIKEAEYQPWFMGGGFYYSTIRFEATNKVADAVAARWNEVAPALKAQLADQMMTEMSSSLGRCMWDRTARLVLVRSSEENPEVKTEFIIPQDSIKRQKDGSWIAYYTDVANNACTHYTYAVRIDQSDADLHVQDSIDLLPRVINGESLYYDEAATINSFTATQGAIATELKRGVLLAWKPSSDAVDEYILLRKEVGSTDAADTLYTGLDVSYLDITAKPSVHYDYTIVASYECNGKHSENNATVQGWRTPYGEISGTILMPDNSGVAGVQVALQKEGTVVRTLITGANGAFRFDSLLYDITGSTEYVIVPTATYGTFRYNNTSAGIAAITLSADNAVATGIDFENADGVRLSGRALYNLSTIPVAGAMFVLNGDTVRRNGAPLTTGIDGNFELTLTKSQPYTLQIIKPGHTFVNDGYLEVTTGERQFALTKPLDGVRFYDRTKVRLVGRVAGGIDQRDLPAAFGLGKNNLGDDLTLVLQLEGDNTAHFVHDPQDLTRDTLMNTFDQKVYSTDPLSAVKERTVGTTSMLTEKKRITIHPDPTTGEYAVELFPVKYKVIQATAKGYATLFASGQASQSFDLSNAPLVSIDSVRGNDSVHYNAVYDRIYRTPVQLQLTQFIYGLEQKGLGEPSTEVNGLRTADMTKVNLYTEKEDGSIVYLLGYPVYLNKRKYQFGAFAYEDYYYNNVPSGTRDRVPERGGSITLHNGLHNTKNSKQYVLDQYGKNNAIWLDVDNLNTESSGTGALCTVSAVLEMEGASVETAGFQAFVEGSRINERELTYTEADISVLDIVRDPGGAGSSAWIESGSTYSAGYTCNFDAAVGVEVTPKIGSKMSYDIGAISSAPGTYMGGEWSIGKQYEFSIPIAFSHSWGYKYSYSVTTSQKISTSSKKNKSGIGANADVFFGTVTAVVSGKAKSVAVINDNLFEARQPAIKAGGMHVLAHGKDSTGAGYYLVTGEKIVVGNAITNTFAYSQHYILGTVIPKLALERYNLLMHFRSEEEAQAVADATNDVVYWAIDSVEAVRMQDTLLANTYRMIYPSSDTTKMHADRVQAIENMIRKWISVLEYNERVKVTARMAGQPIGTYSVNYGNIYTQSASYSASQNENEEPWLWSSFGDLFKDAGTKGASSFLGTWIKNHDNFGKYIFNAGAANQAPEWKFGLQESQIKDVFQNYQNAGSSLPHKNEDGADVANYGGLTTLFQDNTACAVKFEWKPIIDFKSSLRNSTDESNKRATGFTLVPDDQGDITVSVRKAPMDSVWSTLTAHIRDFSDIGKRDDLLYSGYVFYTEAGATYCTHEEEEKTLFYQPGTVLSNPTIMLAKPELSIDTYEQANIPADQRATFRVELRNTGQQQYGMAGSGTVFTLSFIGASNPNGAKVFLGGAALNQTVNYFLTPGQSISQIIEVERGLVDDYENLQLMLSVADCAKTNTMLNFSVHFLPESSPVALAAPRQGWVMNTLSPKDSIGYYLPIDINGFNIRHKNFDHIEFQYKLTSQSDDDWTNLCSFYAEDSLYNLASGNKAMIENGRIVPFRFYGERDPMEQQYDLRAVSFCRHGSGFVTKSSPIISGTKDTRPPRVFGAPQPANAILGVGDDLKLRFNEAIAGNYLDEDNNFQLLGVTNATGITTGTSLHFDGSQDSYVGTKVGRTLSQHSISIDMLVKPTEPNRDEVFFSHEEKDGNVLFGKTADNRLYADINGQRTYSQPLQDPMLDFTRVIVTYDNESKEIRFYAGTLDVTNNANEQYDLNDYKANAPLVFGRGFKGNMLEVRVWTKVLTPEEIALTHLKRLSGYERELAAYYPMNEGRGETLTDKANGATLYTHGATWTNKSGISLALTADQRVQLNSNVLSRSDKQDFTLMFWFKAQEDGTLFSCDKFSITTAQANAFADNEWHHYVLAVNRTMNTASTFVDGEMIDQRSSDSIPSLGGAMYLGGDGFAGNFDEFVLFEQALPKTLMDEYSTMAPVGDEMGLIAYLPFSTLKQNASGVLEQVFSINDQRIFRDANGKVVNKVIPLVLTAADAYADKANYAPLRDHGQLTKLKFDWAFNNDELLININMADREINKQEMYITVRDVEDLHGNPMVSPATWTAFVDKNALKWEYHQITMNVNDNTDASAIYDIQIINNSGKRHQYAIESIPSWLTVNRLSGAMDPMEEKSLRFTFSNDIPVGVYSDIIYLSDEDGLLDPLRIEYTVAAVCPYDEPDEHKYPLNMSICGDVKIGDKYDTDSDDRVIALYRNSCVGMTNIDFDQTRNTSKVHMSIYGNESMNGKTLSFLLWQASTGKVLPLTVTPDTVAVFTHGAVYGCGNEQIVRFTTGGTETQNIALEPGWNWVSYNVDLNAENSLIKNVMTASDQWTEGDIIKTPSTQDFITYSSRRDEFIGTFKTFDYHNIYMFYTKAGNTLRISGNKIPETERFITIAGNKQWTELPCLFDRTTAITDALADYYEQATPGDIVKSHGHFAYFSTNGKWEGDLNALRPGEGYLFRRLGQGDVTIHFYEQKANAPKKVPAAEQPAFRGNSATNMTMICRIDESQESRVESIRAFIGDELVGVATQIDSLYFLTIQTDITGTLRFETEDGNALMPIINQQSSIINYVPNAHHGSLKAPIILIPGDNRPYKIIENNHVIIIRNNEKYSIDGKKL